MERILIGSRAFFGNYNDFENKINRYIELIENPTFKGDKEEITLRGVYTVRLKKEAVKNIINKAVKDGNIILVSAFLIPEVTNAIGAKVKDILPLEPLLENLDQEHQYVANIFKAVKANNSFTLSEEQRKEAYVVYKASRKKEEKTKFPE